MHATVVAYKGRLVIELKARKSIPGEVTTSLDHKHLDCQIVTNTAKHLGVSKEALELLKSVRRGNGAAGELDWSQTQQGHAAFGWKGGRCAIITPEFCEASSQFKVRGFVTIPNEVPEGAKRQLDRMPAPAKSPKGLLTGEYL